MKAHEALKRLTKWLPRKVITGEEGPYITRYFLAVLPNGGHVFLHEIHRPDDKVAGFHNHPWGDGSDDPDEETLCIILSGGYDEERLVPDGPDGALHGATYLAGGSVNVVRANTFHCITKLRDDREPVWTLIITAPKGQTWGFLDKVTKVYKGWEAALEARGLDVDTSSSGQEFPGDRVKVFSHITFGWADRIKILFGGEAVNTVEVQLEVPCAGKQKVTATQSWANRPRWWPQRKPEVASSPSE